MRLKMERPAFHETAPLIGMSELNYRAPPADNCKDQDNQCNHQKNMDIRAEYMEADESEQPQDQKNYKDSP
jgi:hypothetical protein